MAGLNFILVIGIAVIFISKATCESDESNESNELDEIFTKSKMRWRSLCKKSEYDPEFNELNDNSHDEVKTCLTNAIMNSLGERFQNESQPPFSIDSDFEIVCDILPLTISCVRNFTNKYSFCFNETVVEGFDFVYDWGNKISDFMCMNKGRRIKVIYDQVQCIKENSQLNECIQEELNSIYLQINSTTPEEDEPIFTMKDCA
ncbi:hypothetical protein HCN44_000914 [Aphidius gifuensis]|uniref:Odorant-binding protein n=2 Tax=Aphidius gifuensis TaxID=684658 RepID=A0A834XLT1_APHGI|nr:hypothetical protein HCN44_000914 [Aphidius gifuensis]